MSGEDEIELRDAVLNDAQGIAEVQVAAWKSAYRGMIPDAALDALTVAQRTARWSEILAGFPRATIVAEVDSVLVGWSGFGASRDDDRPDGVAEVYGLYVHPDSWRAGAGQLLWDATCDRLAGDGYEAVDVWVLEANERARRFYASMGCTLDSNSQKMFEGDGYSVPEVRYSRAL